MLSEQLSDFSFVGVFIEPFCERASKQLPFLNGEVQFLLSNDLDLLPSGLDFLFSGDRSATLALKRCLISLGEDPCDVGAVTRTSEMLSDFSFLGVFMNSSCEFASKGVSFCGGCVFSDKLGFLVRGMTFRSSWASGKGTDENPIQENERFLKSLGEDLVAVDVNLCLGVVGFW